MGIHRIHRLISAAEQTPTQASGPGNGPQFGEVLRSALQGIDGLQGAADKAVQGLVTGEIQDVHQVLVAFEKARMAFELTMQVRDKLLEAYQEVMRMQV